MKRRGGVQIARGAVIAVVLAAGAVCAAELPLLAPACRAITVDAAWTDCAASVEGGALLVEPAALPLAATDRPQRAAVAAAPLVPGIPEPPTYVLMLAGIAAVGYLAKRRRRE